MHSPVLDAIRDTEEFKKVEPHLRVLRLLWGIHREGKHSGATYDGINYALGFAPRKKRRTCHGENLARKAIAAGWVVAESTGRGPSRKAVLHLTPAALALCTRLFEGSLHADDDVSRVQP